MDRFSELFREVSLYFSKMSSSQKLTLGMFVITISIIFVSLTTIAFQKDTEVLFKDLSKDEESNILAKLESYGIKKEYKDGVITVEKGTRDNILMRLSIDKALPEDKSWGFLANIKKGDSWTDTSASKRQKEIHALEAELSRMIESLEKVSTAKVVVSQELQNKSLYSVDSDKRTAIVTVKLKSGNKINQDEAEGIATIVSFSTAVPMENVKVVDTKGKTYSFNENEDGSGSSTKVEKWELTKSREADYIEKIKNVLSVYNRKSMDDIKVVVSLKMNMDKIVKKSDRVMPDESIATDKRSVEEISSSKSTKGNTVGAPQNAQPGLDNNNDKGGTETNTSKIEKIVKTEVSREVTETIKNPGSVESISVAVTLPHKVEKNKEGVETESPLDPKSIEDARELVLTAVGDPLKIENIVIKSVPYKGNYVEEVVAQTKWYEMLNEFVPPWFSPLKLILAIILFFVVMRLLSITKKAHKNIEVEDDEVDVLVKKVKEGNEEDLKIKELEDNLAKAINEDVKKAASIIKRWAVSG
jgi:flagellar biosynthesis/type III secretory pathway M-ring protein FliF/YscJ